MRGNRPAAYGGLPLSTVSRAWKARLAAQALFRPSRSTIGVRDFLIGRYRHVRSGSFGVRVCQPAPVDPVVPDLRPGQVHHLGDVHLVAGGCVPGVLPHQPPVLEEKLAGAVETHQFVGSAAGAAIEELPQLLVPCQHTGGGVHGARDERAFQHSARGIQLEEVLLDGGMGQRRVADALAGLSVLWVGVRCDPAAAARENARIDTIPRVAGMATLQAARVHHAVRYDVVVDTAAASSEECAQTVLAHITRP